MLVYSQVVFDDVMEGTATSRYSGTDVAEALGRADALAVFATLSYVGGTGPTLSVQLEHSADGQLWLPVNSTPEIDAKPMANNFPVQAQVTDKVFLGFVRLRLSLGGTNPRARVRASVCGRANGA